MDKEDAIFVGRHTHTHTHTHTILFSQKKEGKKKERKRKEIVPLATIGMDFNTNTLSEIKEKQILYDLTCRI